MSHEDDEIDLKSKIINIILVCLLVIAIGWVNYVYFSKHISSNPERINNFIAVDVINKFHIPVTAVFFYPYNEHGKKFLASESSPRILVVPHSGYLYSKANVEKAYKRLLPWAQKIKNVILLAPSTNKIENLNLSKNKYLGTKKENLAVDQKQNKKIQDMLKKVTFVNMQKETAIMAQVPLIYKNLGDEINFLPVIYSSEQKENIKKILQPYLENDRSLIIFSADISGYYTQEKTAAEKDDINLIMDIAQTEHLYPKVFDLVNFEDIAEQNYRLSELKPSKPIGTLEQETENLLSFAQIYGADLLTIARKSLEEAVLKQAHYKPTREEYNNILFNRGAVYVNLYKHNELRGRSGSLLPSQAVSYAVAQNVYDAAIEDKNHAPISAQEYADIKVEINLLTGFERIDYQNEADLLKKLQPQKDGVVLRDGNRQGVFLPSEWKKYTTSEEFLHNLKIATGISPAYWSNRIKVYRFRVVEIKENAV